MRRPWHVAPATHEADAYLNYATGDLAAYRALAARVAAADGEATATVEHYGRTYDVALRGKRSGLDAPGEAGPSVGAGRTAEGGVRELLLQLAPRDGVPEETRTFTVSPRWPGMGTAYDPPAVGVSVRAQGVNEPLDAYPALIRAAFAAFDAPTGGLDAPGTEGDAPASTLLGTARYVRVHRRHGEAFMGPTGMVARLTEGVPGAKERASGGRREVVLPADGLATLLRDTAVEPDFGVVLKAYTARDPCSDDADPLAHPKVEVRLDDRATTTWRDREAVVDALDTVLLNVLAWAGLPPRPDDGSTYVPDHYFDATEAASAVDLADSPFDALDAEADTVAKRALAGLDKGATDREVLRVAADGGHVHVDDVADEAGCSRRTVYRVADRHDALDVVKGVLRFVTRGVRTAISRSLDVLSQGVARLVGRGDGEGEQSPRDDDGASLAVLRAAYAIELQDPTTDPDASYLRAHVRDPPAEADVPAFFDAFREAWSDSHDPARLTALQVVVDRPGGQEVLRPFAPP